MRKISLKQNLTVKKHQKKKTSPTASTRTQNNPHTQTLHEIYSGKIVDCTAKKQKNTKKPPSGKKSLTKPSETKPSKHSKTKTYQNGFPLTSSTSDPDRAKKSSEKNRAASALEHCPKKYFKSSHKFSTHRNKSPTSELLHTLKSHRGKIFDLIQTRLKSSKFRSLSSRRASKDAKKSLKSIRSNSLGKPCSVHDLKPDSKYEKISFQHPVSCRENYFEDTEFPYKSNEQCKTHKIAKKTISLMDTEEFCNINEQQNPSLDPTLQKKTKKPMNIENSNSNFLSNPPKFTFPVSALTFKTNKEKSIENFTRNHAAKVIQKNFRRYLDSVHCKNSATRLQEIVKDQIGWKEAQILTLEYLKQKELEDLQFLSGILGRNSPLEKLLAKTVKDRYDNFSKFFKENLEGVEQKFREAVDITLDEKPNNKKEVVSKIIQENNMSSSLTKLQMETLIKTEPTLIKVFDHSEACENWNKPEPDKPDFPSTNRNLSLQETENLDPVLLSPIFPETMNFPDLSSLIIEEDKEDKLVGVNGVPEPLDRNGIYEFSLEALINAKTPQSRAQLPLLNLETVPIVQDVPSERRIETHSGFIQEFLTQTFEVIGKNVLNRVCCSLVKDPLAELEKVHNDFNDFEDRFGYEPVLDIEEVLSKLFSASEAFLSTDRQLMQADKIHKKMVLAAADEVLQYFRPYGIKGVPPAWSFEGRLVSKQRNEVEDVFQGFIGYVVELSLCQIGKIPTENMILADGNLDEGALAEARKEALEFSIKRDILETDWIWNDFEFEETQVKLDLADIVLSELAEELVNLI